MQESESTIIPSTSLDDVPQNPLSRDHITSVIEQKVAETLKRTLLGLLGNALSAPDFNNSPNVETNEGEPIAKKGKVQDDHTQFLSATSSRAYKCYVPVQEATIFEELLSFLKSAFTNQLSKEV